MPKKFLIGKKEHVFNSMMEAVDYLYQHNLEKEYVVGNFLGEVSTQTELSISIPNRKTPKKIKVVTPRTEVVTQPLPPSQPHNLPPITKLKKDNKCTFDNNESILLVHTPEGVPVNLCEMHTDLELPLKRGDWDINELS